jgi:chromosome segregation ATPase
MRPDDSPQLDETEFERAIADVEAALATLKARYTQVKQDQRQRSQLIQQARHTAPALKTELARLQQEIDTIDLNLESRLFRWRSLLHPFWMAVRFGGLGILIGWLLHTLAQP